MPSAASRFRISAAQTLSDVDSSLLDASHAGVKATEHVRHASRTIGAALMRLRRGNEAVQVLGQATGTEAEGAGAGGGRSAAAGGVSMDSVREEADEDEDDDEGRRDAKVLTGNVGPSSAGLGAASMAPQVDHAELARLALSSVAECRAALRAAHAAAEEEVESVGRDLRRRHDLVDRLTECMEQLLVAEDGAHAAGISDSPVVAAVLEQGNAEAAAAQKLMAITMRRELPGLERTVSTAEASIAHAVIEVDRARTTIVEAEDERSKLRERLHPIHSRIAALTAAVEVGSSAIRASTRVMESLMRAHAAAERASVALTGRGRGRGMGMGRGIGAAISVNADVVTGTGNRSSAQRQSGASEANGTIPDVYHADGGVATESGADSGGESIKQEVGSSKPFSNSSSKPTGGRHELHEFDAGACRALVA